MDQIHSTREAWLIAAMRLLDHEFFDGSGYELPEKLGISCGFPLGKRSAIGQCWDPTVTQDGTIHMFICPSIGEPTRVLDITLHEMIHAAVGLECGHKGAFKKLALEFGLEGKMTATYVTEGTELHQKLELIAERLGKYPHSPLNKTRPKKLRVSGSVTMVSPQDPAFHVKMRRKLLEEVGAPYDPWGNEMHEKGMGEGE